MSPLSDRTSHVYIDGHRHEILDPDSLENLAYSADLTITLPQGAGWAVTRVGSARFAAWVREPFEVER
jgi:hypothetical protein